MAVLLKEKDGSGDRVVGESGQDQEVLSSLAGAKKAPSLYKMVTGGSGNGFAMPFSTIIRD